MAAALMVMVGCKLLHKDSHPTIEFTNVPRAAEGGPEAISLIAGRASGATPDQQIVLYAKAGVWWVQPLGDKPFTPIEPDSTWSSPTHRGTEYAALLVNPGYKPSLTLKVLPTPGGLVAAVATVPGSVVESDARPFRTVQFSGYQWKVRSAKSDRNGVTNQYDPSNAWTDSKGYLHLRIERRGETMTCAEVTLMQTLGYGTYHVSVQDTNHFDPSVVFGIFTWEDAPIDRNHREMDVELSRWGDPKRQNARYVIQPYYVAANISRFEVPGGLLTHTIRWNPQQVSFETTRGNLAGTGTHPIARHVFTSGIPTSGSESLRMNFCGVGDATRSLQHEDEVVVENFQYLP